mmetsp:Transcript_25303/g.48353  ORF Transcript_25303/g.48353 Transcript_25303/m.48353 type:complete len:150 (-) Transcript_25303:132-581(-)
MSGDMYNHSWLIFMTGDSNCCIPDVSHHSLSLPCMPSRTIINYESSTTLISTAATNTTESTCFCTHRHQYCQQYWQQQCQDKGSVKGVFNRTSPPRPLLPTQPKMPTKMNKMLMTKKKTAKKTKPKRRKVGIHLPPTTLPINCYPMFKD